MTKKAIASVLASGIFLSACAGRAPQDIQVARPFDHTATCEQLVMEIQGAQSTRRGLLEEAEDKRIQNVAAIGIGVVLFLPALFLMDTQDAALKEAQQYDVRIVHLHQMYQQRCGGEPIELMVRSKMIDPMAPPATAKSVAGTCAEPGLGETWEDFEVRGCSRTGPTAVTRAQPRNALTGGSAPMDCETQRTGETWEDFDNRCG